MHGDSLDDLNDFDDDLDNLDDILYDDDDDKDHAKKKSPVQSPEKKISRSPHVSPVHLKQLSESKPSTPTKKTTNLSQSFDFLNKDVSESPSTDIKTQSDIKFQIKTDKSNIKTSTPEKKSKTITNKSFTFESEPNILSPKKTSKPSKNKLDLFLEEDTKYLDDLGFNNLGKENKNITHHEEKVTSPVKSSAAKKMDDIDFEDDNDDILDDLDNSSPQKNAGKKSISFMDDLLSKPSKSTSKPHSAFEGKSKVVENKDSIDDDFTFGGYVPTATSSSRSAPASRRRSAKFGDEVSSRNVLQDSPDHKTSAEITKPNKKMGDDDFLSFLKSDLKPKSLSSPVRKRDDSSFEHQQIDKDISTNVQRKSSGADWLGLGTEFEGSPTKTATTVKDSPKHAPVTKQASAGKIQLPWLDASSHLDDTDSLPSKPQEIKKQTVLPPAVKPVTNTPVVTGAQPLAGVATSMPIVQNVPNTISSPIIQKSQTEMYNQQPVQTSFPSNIQFPQTPASHVSPSLLLPAGDNANITAYQTMLNSVQLERDQLLKSVEIIKKRSEEDADSVKESLKKQQKLQEEEFEKKLKSIKEEYESELRKLKTNISTLESEKQQLVQKHKDSMENLEQDHGKEFQKLKDLHNEAISMMKHDHQSALERLRKLKDQEVEAISSTQLQTRSLQSLADQLEARTSELAALQVKVEEKQQRALQEKQALLSSKEKELKNLENRLRSQIEDGEEERSRLQQLVLRLENRLQTEAKLSEEERWEMQKLKAKLEVQQKYLEDEKKTQSEYFEKEKEKLQSLQNNMMQEQKMILMQLVQERQLLSSERIEQESRLRKVREEETRLSTRKFKEDTIVESQRMLLRQDDDKLQMQKEMIRQESQQLRIDRESLDRERRQMKDEKDRIEDMKHDLKRRSDDVEDLALRVAADKEEGKAALAAARRIESDHHNRMNQFTQQMQAIMEKEKQLLQEKEKLENSKKELLEKKDSMLCANCKIAIGLPVTNLPPNVNQIRPPFHLTPGIPTHSTMFDPNLMVWYMTAQKDRDYLQEELSFVQSLKEYERKKTS